MTAANRKPGWVRPLLLLVAAAAAVAVALAGCGGDCRAVLSSGLAVACSRVPPGPDDPAFGGMVQVLVVDAESGDSLWIGIDAEEEAAGLQALVCTGEPFWIGGVVVVATDRPLGFFFDPATTFVTADHERETTIAQIEGDPTSFSVGKTGTAESWLVPANVLAVERLAGDQCLPDEDTAGTGVRGGEDAAVA